MEPFTTDTISRPTLSVIMPCHNEARSITLCLGQVVETLRRDAHGGYEIIVVDDGSTDDSWVLAQSVARAAPEVRVIRHLTNGGKGNALREAFSEARGEIVCFLDCGRDLRPDHVTRFMEALEADSAEVIVGSKRHPESRIDYPWRRRVMSKAYELFVRSLFGLRIRDTQAGIKVFRREVLEQVLPLGLVKRYAFDAELLVLAHRLGYGIKEMPIEMAFKQEFGSSVDAKAIVQMFFDTLGVFYRLRIKGSYGLSARGQHVGG